MAPRIPSLSASTLFAVAAVFHAAALAWPEVSEPSPAWRHAVFVAINALYAVLFARRPRWLFSAYAPLAVQQLISHGLAFRDAYRVGHIDGQSVVALATIPFFVWVAWTARERAKC